jgi:serine protease Do
MTIRKSCGISRHKKISMGLFLCCLIALIGNRVSVYAQDSDLVSQIQRIKPGIVAVGTYYFNDRPAIQFRGTGFAVGDGTLIVTNAHTITAITQAKKITRLRVFHDHFPPHGQPATVVKEDEKHDLALLKIEKSSLPSLKVADSADVKEGEDVAFTGYPLGLILGLNPTTHRGIISAISPIVIPSPNARAMKKEIVAFLRHPFDVFQIDATAYPGNSGSPVFRIATGEVIGIINMVFVKGKKENLITKPSGITYAIPSNYARALIENSTK